MGIHLDKVRKSFRGRDGSDIKVLDVPELVIDDGRQLCLVGGSGSGKTTLLNLLSGIVKPTSGRIIHDGIDLASLSEAGRDRFRAERIGIVFQTFNLLQGMTALENVLIAASFAGHRGAEPRRRAEELLTRMKLGHRMHEKPGTLSVGEQQRVAIARAVINHPAVVLADEPTANLDDENGAEVLELLKEVTSEDGSILILVTHDGVVIEAFDDVVPLAEISA